jgi:hypothetical protein
MKKLLLLTLLFLAGMYTAQAQNCTPNPACQAVCTKAKADNTTAAATLVNAAPGEGVAAETAKCTAAKDASTMSSLAKPVSQTTMAGQKKAANCDPSKCEVIKCDPSNCNPKNCDPSKCVPVPCAKPGEARATKV